MALPIFYAPEFNLDAAVLPADEAKHALRVLRLKAGDEIQVTDGRGGWYRCHLLEGKECPVEVLSSQEEFGKKAIHFHLACAPTKNNTRFEWMLEKNTELGINRITPLLCAHSERKVLKHERMNKILTAAMKQSQRAYHPKLDELSPFSEFINFAFAGQKFIAHCGDEERLLLKDRYQQGNDCLILIGPEGDFSENEIKEAIEAGFEPISLGSNRLRTETAAIAACHTINLINE